VSGSPTDVRPPSVGRPTEPARQRQIIRLRFFEGLTQSEIASRLGISQMHVSRLLARSVAELRAAGLKADERA